jgi:hypothetical protein
VIPFSSQASKVIVSLDVMGSRVTKSLSA